MFVRRCYIIFCLSGGTSEDGWKQATSRSRPIDMNKLSKGLMQQPETTLGSPSQFRQWGGGSGGSGAPRDAKSGGGGGLNRNAPIAASSNPFSALTENKPSSYNNT